MGGLLFRVGVSDQVVTRFVRGSPSRRRRRRDKAPQAFSLLSRLCCCRKTENREKKRKEKKRKEKKRKVKRNEKEQTLRASWCFPAVAFSSRRLLSNWPRQPSDDDQDQAVRRLGSLGRVAPLCECERMRRGLDEEGRVDRSGAGAVLLARRRAVLAVERCDRSRRRERSPQAQR
ncbi:hypothetical protein BDZ91DRAFT_745366 [Kalaharituber pfeilii]|nr:hypothetical protein BDZ91DRAFT_745366 [Kalaharituber pfeilii]